MRGSVPCIQTGARAGLRHREPKPCGYRAGAKAPVLFFVVWMDTGPVLCAFLLSPESTKNASPPKKEA